MPGHSPAGAGKVGPRLGSRRQRSIGRLIDRRAAHWRWCPLWPPPSRRS